VQEGAWAEHSTKTVKEICLKRRWFTVNRNYQREDDVWSGEDKKYLVDSILKGYDIPKIYLRLMPDDILEIVDGQQRFDTIWKFRDDKITLSGDITGNQFDGQPYSQLDDDTQNKFDEYKLDTVILHNYDDERVRDLFTRLQRGKPLNPAERLNAYSGAIVPTMRLLGDHNFFKIVNFQLSRYKPYLIAARMMLLQHTLETYGTVVDIGPNELYSFFADKKDLSMNYPAFQSVKQDLDYMYQAFTFKQGKVPELSSESWVINLYLLTARLKKKYAMKGKEVALGDFYVKFWLEAEGLRERKVKPSLNKISNEFLMANSSGTGAKDRLEIREKEMISNFLNQVKGLEILDPNRAFDTYEKVVIYRNGNGKCAKCGRQVPWDEFEADHIFPWSLGGQTTLDNAQLLCRDCNRSKSDIVEAAVQNATAP
jgi:hypothetical protein